MRTLVQGVTLAAGLALGLAAAEQLRDPTSWLRLRMAELHDYLQEARR